MIQKLCPPFLNFMVTLQLFVQFFSTRVPLNGSWVLRIAQVVDTVFEPDLVRPVFQASHPVLQRPSDGCSF